jgi:hypothetical protein
MSFDPLRFAQADIGAMVASSKRRFFWEFELEGQTHNVLLEASMLTNKRKVVVDGEQRYNGFKALGGAFQYSFYVDGHTV